MRLALILALALSGAAAPAALAQEGCAATHAAQTEAEMLADINRLRADHGLAALRVDRRLSRIAQAHACDNAARNSYSHTGSDGSDLGRRLDRGGYPWREAVENTGLGHATVQAMLGFWTRSPGHMANLTARGVTEAGLGLARTGNGRNTWVLVLGRR